MKIKPLLVGEANPYGSDPSFALYHLPRGASGDRLREILGLTDVEYLDRFERVNLIEGDYWSRERARKNAEQLHAKRDLEQVFVLLGSKVVDAFDLVCKDFPREAKRYPDPFIAAAPSPLVLVACPTFRRCVLLPHPSGRNRRWREPGLAERCREMVMEICK